MHEGEQTSKNFQTESAEGRREEILKRRSKTLSTPKTAMHVEDTVEIAVFLLGNDLYGFDIEHLREVCTLSDVTYIPCAPNFVVGVINLRGQIIPILDILLFMNMSGNSDRPCVFNKAIILERNKLVVGFLVDEVIGARQVPVSSLQQILHADDGHKAEYVKGITKERLVVLDAGKLLEDPRLTGRSEA
jgi:purine-binding chemotaxis protein CheW